MMSRITLHLKKQGRSTTATSMAGRSWNDNHELSTITRKKRSLSNAAAGFRPHPYIPPVISLPSRPPPIQAISTVTSERSSVVSARIPSFNVNSTHVSADIAGMLWDHSKLRERLDDDDSDTCETFNRKDEESR